jgi:hypothetical protein
MSTVRSVILIMGCSAIAACSDSTGGDDPEVIAIEIFEGNNQTGTASGALAIDPAVRVTADGEPKSGVTVNFAVTQGGGIVTGPEPVSDANGIARVNSWLMGAAGPQALSATVANATGSPLTFTATSNAPVPTMIEAVDNPTTGTVGAVTAQAPRVRVESATGVPIAGVPVVWAVTGGGGAIAGAELITSSDGTASAGSWTLGNLVSGNPNTLTATTTCCGMITFSAVADAGPVTTITKVSGDLQTALVSTAVAVNPMVELKDVFGNAAANRAITFVVTAGGGAVTGGTANSAADGTAAVGSWTLGPVAGANVLTATVNALTVTFNATGTMPFNMNGTYTGTWTNTTFASVGTGTVTITVNPTTNAATVTASATGNVLGGGPASPPVQNGTFVPGGTTNFVGSVAPMGTITASMDASGHIVASATNIPNPGITSWTAVGDITQNTIMLTFTVNFTAGAPAVGTINLTRVP